MSLTLRFTEWQCGHHCQRPADIPVSDPAQATLILQAISHAISQPGHARAALLGTDSAQFAYITDDYVSVGHASQPEFSTDGRGWSCRPQVICCTAEQQAEIHGEALNDAVEALYVAIDRWDGTADVQDVQIVTTTLTRAEVETLSAPLDAFEERHIPFELPPVFLDAATVLDELRTEAAYQAQPETDHHDGSEEVSSPVRLVWGARPTVHPTTLDFVLNEASAEVWWAERNLSKLPEGDAMWHHWHGRQTGLYVLLQSCGALPTGPLERSSEKLHRALVAARTQLPDGFEAMPVLHAYQFLASCGVELALDEVPYLKRHLLAKRQQKDVALQAPASASEPDQDQPAVGRDIQDGAGSHAVILSEGGAA